MNNNKKTETEKCVLCRKDTEASQLEPVTNGGVIIIESI